jgi:putative addiction module CopG family antidote
MPSKTTMNVNLSEDLYKYVKSAVASGRYTSASDFVRTALRTNRELVLAEIGRKIDEGLASLDRGESISGDDAMAEFAALSAGRRRRKKTA